MESFKLPSNRNVIPLLLLLVGVVYLFPFLGKTPLFDWDELNFAESSREMIITGNYQLVQIDFQPFHEKPPLFFWMQAACMHLLGINEYAARFPNAIIGILTILTLYLIGRKMKGELFGLLWSLTYFTMLVPFVYFKSGVIDPTFNLFIFLSVFFAYKTIHPSTLNHDWKTSLLAGAFAGLGTLTKGPVALLLVALTILVYWISQRCRRITSLGNILLFGVSYALVTSLWFGAELIQNGPWFLVEFVKYQIELLLTPVAGHSQPFFYHFLVVFLGCFPASVFALPVLFKKPDEQDQHVGFIKWMKILFWVVMIVFTIVKTKILHYSSQAYFPVSYFAALYLYQCVNRNHLSKSIINTILTLGLIFASAVMLTPFLPRLMDRITPYINDPFAVASMNTTVVWSGYEFLIGVIWIILIIISTQLLRKTTSIQKGILLLWFSITTCLLFSLGFIVPKVARYTQGPAIDYLQALRGKKVYINTVDYKSYAHFFYAERMPDSPKSEDLEWLLTGDIDYPSYFLAHTTSRDYFKNYPSVKLIREEGGFLLYERLPPK